MTSGGPPRVHPVGRALLYLGGTLILTPLAAYPALWAICTFQGSNPAERIREVAKGQEPLLLLAANAVAALVVLGFTWAFLRLVDREDLSSIGFRRERAATRLVAFFLLGALLPLPVLGAGLVSGVYRLAPGHAGPVWWVLALLFAGFLVQAAGEELVLRGYVQSVLARWRPRGAGHLLAAVLAPSLIFGALHGANPGFGPLAFLNTVLWGVVFALLVRRQGALWGVFGLHAGWNFGLAVLWSLPVSGLGVPRLLPVELVPRDGADWLFGGAYGPEGGLITTGLLIACISRYARSPETRTD